MIGPLPSSDAAYINGSKAIFERPWYQWFAQAYLLLFANQQSGTTAQRPTANLWIGRRYFDTALGKPVYLKSNGPNVWVDGAGTVS